MNDYAMYLRKSRSDIELESISKFETLSRHENILKDLANKKDLHIAKVYKEIVSGESIESRPMMKQLLKDIYEQKYKGVLVVEVERLARGDTKDQGIVAEAFTMTNTLIVTPTKTYDPNNEFDEEYFEFGLFMSRREYKTITRRMRKGVLESVKSGNYIGSKTPYGYRKVRLNKKDLSLVIDEEESKIVKMIFDLYTKEHLTVAQISHRLYELHIPTQQGNREWNHNSIRETLKNKIYIGKITWNKRKVRKQFEDGKIVKKVQRNKDNVLVVDGKHEPIISVEQFNLAQTLFKKQPPIKKSNDLRNALSGLLFCSKCGRSMIRAYRKQKPTVAPRYVHAVTRECSMKSCKTDDVINAVVEHLKSKIYDYEIAITDLSNSSIIDDYNKKIDRLSTELKKSQVAKERLFEFLEDGTYTKEEFMTRKNNVLEKIKCISKELSDLTSNKPNIETFENKTVRYRQAIETLKDTHANARELNLLLKGIIKKIDFTSIDLGKGKGVDITLDIYYL